MSTLDQYRPASFRGVDFLMRSEAKTGGKKVAIHNFVNSDQRFVEELGELPPSFVLQAIITQSTTNGIGDDNAIQRRFDLEAALVIPGVGELVHPIYGSVFVKSTTFSVNSSQSDIGRFDFSINFEFTAENVTVEPQLLTNSAVSAAAEDARDSLFNALEGGYENPLVPPTVTSLADKLTGILETVQTSITSVVDSAQSKLSEFTAIVDNAKDQVFAIVQTGADLKSSLESVYSAALSVVNFPERLLDTWLDLTDFGFSDLRGDTNTVYRQNKENDLSVMNEQTRINAMINLYEATVYSEFGTETELAAAQNTLDDVFTRLMANFDSDIDPNVTALAKDPAVRESVYALRTITNMVMDQKENNIWRVVGISPGLSSMALTSYRYYGSLGNIDLLKSLNNEINWSNSDKDIQAVSL